MKSYSFYEWTFLFGVALLTPILLTMLSLLPLISAPFPVFVQEVLDIPENPSYAQEIFSYVRAKVVNPGNEQAMNDLSRREITHLDDVSTLIRNLYVVVIGSLSGTLLAGFVLRPRREIWLLSLRAGAIFTLFLIATSAILALVSWESAFYGFHQVFFEKGSWRFSTTSTLIRNFPPRFWVFSAVCMAGLLSLFASCILYLTHMAQRTKGDIE